jgi:zinc transporter ZupT
MCVNNCALCPDDILEEPASWSICPEVVLCNDTEPTSDHVGLGFGLTIGAGLATGLGALLLFIPCVKETNTWILTICLSLAAGVMLYIPFTKILPKAISNFCCLTQDYFHLVATIGFFVGVLLTILLDLLLGGLQKLECECCCNLPSQLKRGNLFTRTSPVSVTYGATTTDSTGLDTVPLQDNDRVSSPTGSVLENESSDSSEEALEPKAFQMTQGKSTKRLLRMGILTGTALHAGPLGPRVHK